MSTIVTHTIYGWSALDGDDTAGYELIASADTIDVLLPLLRDREVAAFTVELIKPRPPAVIETDPLTGDPAPYDPNGGDYPAARRTASWQQHGSCQAPAGDGWHRNR